MLDARQEAVIDNELRVRAALRELGLTPEILNGALGAGPAGAAMCTGITHPISGERPCGVRDCPIPARTVDTEGWRRDDADNLPTVVRADGALGIAVARGNCDTGKADGRPTTQYAKGPTTSQAIERNAYLPSTHPREIRSRRGRRCGCCCTTARPSSCAPSSRSRWRSKSRDTSRPGERDSFLLRSISTLPCFAWTKILWRRSGDQTTLNERR